MSVMAASTTTTHSLRRPNSTHLESLLVTDFYGINSEDAATFIGGPPSPTSQTTNENFYIPHDVPHDSPRSFSHKRERSLPLTNNVIEAVPHTNAIKDDTLIYANFSEIQRERQGELIDRQPKPPIPNANEQPIRILQNKWAEYLTVGGRSYFYNQDLGVSQWMPPRNAQNAAKKVSNPFVKAPTMIEPVRKQSFCDAIQNNSHTSTFCVDMKQKSIDQVSSSLSADSTSTESLKYAEPPLVTHATNPLIEKELLISKPSIKVDPLDKSTSFRGPSNVNPMPYRKFVTEDTRINNTGPSCSSSLNTTTTFPVSTITNEMSASMSATSSLRSRNFFMPSSAIYQGMLEKCRLLDGLAKVKKNQWSTAYAFLYSGHLLFYRDQKSAEKNGKHYPAPIDVCDLRGAKVSHSDGEKFKDKRHKNVISLQLPNNIIYLFSCVENEDNIQEWYNALRDAILSLPQLPEYVPEHGSLGRVPSKSTPFNSKQVLRQSIKNGTKATTNNKSKVDTDVPTKDSIIDRLLRFLRSRPTMETLSERGIYRSEPVFGSTLTAVCEHDRAPVPRFITEITAIIEKRGLKIDGLYRVSGNLSSIQKLRCLIDQDRYDSLNKEEDVHVLTGALKLFLRELHDPVIPMELNKEFISATRESPRSRFKTYDELLKRLPEVNRNTLAILIGHLRRVAQHSSENRMQIHNLAIVFGPALFHSEGRAPKTHQRRNSGFLSKKQPPTTEQKTMPSQSLAYNMVVFGQITESILNDAKNFSIFVGMPI